MVDFCVVLEELGKRAYPESGIEERSMEYAQIALENIKQWPEQVQMLSALHNVDPNHAHEKVKELAISIEQSRAINGIQEPKRTPRPYNDWRSRASEVNNGEGNRRDFMPDGKWRTRKTLGLPMKHPHERCRVEIVKAGVEIEKTGQSRTQTETRENATNAADTVT